MAIWTASWDIIKVGFGNRLHNSTELGKVMNVPGIDKGCLRMSSLVRINIKNKLEQQTIS